MASASLSAAADLAAMVEGLPAYEEDLEWRVAAGDPGPFTLFCRRNIGLLFLSIIANSYGLAGIDYYEMRHRFLVVVILFVSQLQNFNRLRSRMQDVECNPCHMRSRRYRTLWSNFRQSSSHHNIHPFSKNHNRSNNVRNRILEGLKFKESIQ